MMGKKLIIITEGRMQNESLNELRDKITKELSEGIVVVDSTVKSIMVIDDFQDLEIKAGENEWLRKLV